MSKYGIATSIQIKSGALADELLGKVAFELRDEALIGRSTTTWPLRCSWTTEVLQMLPPGSARYST